MVVGGVHGGLVVKIVGNVVVNKVVGVVVVVDKAYLPNCSSNLKMDYYKLNQLNPVKLKLSKQSQK